MVSFYALRCVLVLITIWCGFNFGFPCEIWNIIINRSSMFQIKKLMHLHTGYWSNLPWFVISFFIQIKKLMTNQGRLLQYPVCIYTQDIEATFLDSSLVSLSGTSKLISRVYLHKWKYCTMNILKQGAKKRWYCYMSVANSFLKEQ